MANPIREVSSEIAKVVLSFLLSSNTNVFCTRKLISIPVPAEITLETTGLKTEPTRYK